MTILAVSEGDPDVAERELAAAAAVARGVMRLFARHDIFLTSEVALRNNRRADLMGVDARGRIVLVEIKCSRADLMGDAKWPEYLDFCDRFYWAVPPELDPVILNGEQFLPARSGVIVADGYDAEILREASSHPLAAARRKIEVQRLARLAMRRLSLACDPEMLGGSERMRSL